MSERFADYAAVERYLMGALPMFQRDGGAAYKASLETSLRLDDLDGHPHLMYRTVHVAGTNGKGSVSHMLCAALMGLGYRVGLFTSPHLVDYRERIRVNGLKISSDYVVSYVREHADCFDELRPSFFEISSALAFSYFSDSEVDIAVIETGMGGRLDSTNIIRPVVSVITNVSMDHTAFLGETLESIAREKAGIIKHKVPVVLGACVPRVEKVLEQRAEGLQAPVSLSAKEYVLESQRESDGLHWLRYRTLYGKTVEVRTDLLGRVQGENVATVLTTLDVFKARGLHRDVSLEGEAFAHVSQVTGLRGRWEVMCREPLVVFDTGHNEAGFAQVLAQVHETSHAALHAVLGFSNDKDVEKFLALLPRDGHYYWCAADVPRALSVEELLVRAVEFSLSGSSYQGVGEALGAALLAAKPEDMVLVGGSTFVVADALREYGDKLSCCV